MSCGSIKKPKRATLEREEEDRRRKRSENPQEQTVREEVELLRFGEAKMASLNLMETELCLGLPGGGGGGGEVETPKASGNKRAFSATVDLKLSTLVDSNSKQDLVNHNSKDAKALLKDPAKPPPK